MIPEPVQRLESAIAQLPGVISVEIGLRSLDGISVSHLGLPAEFATLPHLALRRSDGGFAHETLVFAEIWLEQSRKGWIALEYLAWWVRDLCRSGESVQLRPTALPAKAPHIQLGGTLKFCLEFFIVEPSDDPSKIADRIGQHGDWLKLCLQSDADAFNNPSDPNYGCW